MGLRPKPASPQRSKMNPHPHSQSVYFGGSRSVQAPSPIISQVVGSVLAAGHAIHVGCCVGADALVISSALCWRGQSSLFVFAISSASGAGSCSLSSSLPKAAAGMGASVTWQAGAPAHAPLAARLASRSLAAAKGCQAAVFFSPGSGSLSVAARLVSSMPIFAFCDPAPAQLPGCAGVWVPSSFHGFNCWQWSSAQQSLF